MRKNKKSKRYEFRECDKKVNKKRKTDLESLTFSHSLFGNAARSTVFMQRQQIPSSSRTVAYCKYGHIESSELKDKYCSFSQSKKYNAPVVYTVQYLKTIIFFYIKIIYFSTVFIQRQQIPSSSRTVAYCKQCEDQVLAKKKPGFGVLYLKRREILKVYKKKTSSDPDPIKFGPDLRL